MTAAMLTSLLSALNIFRELNRGKISVAATFCKPIRETDNCCFYITNNTVPIWHDLFCSGQSVCFF